MLIQIWIFDKDERYVFDYTFHESLTKQQIESINNILPPLVKITTKTQTSRPAPPKTFSIVGLHLHFYLYQNYLVVLSTILGLTASYFQSFVEKTIRLVDSMRSIKPHFNLRINQYFIQKLTRDHSDIENVIFNVLNSQKESMIEKNMASVLRVTSDQQNNKYLMMGGASAGKSSIIVQFFENWSHERIDNIKPTVLQKIKTYKDPFISEPFLMLDLGGQDAYRKQHLQNHRHFLNVRSLIFVIDVQNYQATLTVQDYFRSILQQLKKLNMSPPIAVFLHKYDPGIKNVFNPRVQFWLEWFDQLIESPEFKHFHVNYHLTSIRNNSAREALARTLLITLPQWFIGQTVERDLIVKATNSLYPIVGQLKASLTTEQKQHVELELYQNSLAFGYEVAKLLIRDWMNYLLGATGETDLKSTKATLLKVESVPTEKKVRFCLTCPLKDELKEFPMICEITHGLFEGVGKFLGFQKTELLQTQIRDGTDECLIELSY